jgi:hypothetical protein
MHTARIAILSLLVAFALASASTPAAAAPPEHCVNWQQDLGPERGTYCLLLEERCIVSHHTEEIRCMHKPLP